MNAVRYTKKKVNVLEKEQESAQRDFEQEEKLKLLKEKQEFSRPQEKTQTA